MKQETRCNGSEGKLKENTNEKIRREEKGMRGQAAREE